MIQLSNGTYLPETLIECQELANKEATTNFQNYYNAGNRSDDIRKRDIYIGKLHEGLYCLWLKNRGVEIKSAVRAFQKTRDDGADVTYIASDGVERRIQIKTFNLNDAFKTYTLDSALYKKMTDNKRDIELIAINRINNDIYYVKPSDVAKSAVKKTNKTNNTNFYTIDISKLQKIGNLGKY